MHLSNTLPHNNRIEIGCEGQEKAKKKRVREGAPGCKAPLLLLSAGLELRLEESRRAFPVIEGLSGAL